ncbi:MAG: triose-phosphate isomerase [Acetobacteraceae bacterium]
MPQLIAGNWKMHKTRAEAVALAAALRAAPAPAGARLLVCPPFTALAAVADALAGSAIAVGGQDCHMAPQGAHTGDISAPMLKEAGAGWVILGHSERRQNHGETSEQVREKVLAALAAGLTPIVCVGETADQRAAGAETDTVGWQLSGSLPTGFAGVVAYEPVWAIGSGRTPTPDEVAAMHGFIRAELTRQFAAGGAGLTILYGGSVNAGNAPVLLELPEVGGALVGGASLTAEAFLGIAAAAR